jgi:hypothetical protein
MRGPGGIVRRANTSAFRRMLSRGSFALGGGTVALPPDAPDLGLLPSDIQALAASDLDDASTSALLHAIARGLPDVALSNQSDDQFQFGLNCTAGARRRSFTRQGIEYDVNGGSFGQIGTSVRTRGQSANRRVT